MTSVIAGISARLALSRRAFWTAFAVLFGLALAVRVGWTFILGAPYVVHDSWGYVQAALSGGAFPMSEVRTVGYPALVSIALALFGDPVGILIVHNGFWVVSTLAIVLVLYRWLGLRVWALVALAYLGFAGKNLAFEYLLLSEHVVRALYVLVLALLIITAVDGPRWRVTLALALLIVAATLTRPPAIVLVGGAMVCFAGLAVHARRTALVHAAVVMAIVAVGMAGYGLAFKERYGSFGLTNFTGYNLFAHFGHRTVLDSGKYPDIKKELAAFLPRYVARYSARGIYKGNWLVFGSRDRTLTADFGEQSPARVVAAYARRMKSTESQTARMNRIYMDLAVEAIRAHPTEYVWYSLGRAARVATKGLSLTYGDYFRDRSRSRHGEGARELARRLAPWIGSERASPRYDTALGTTLFAALSTVTQALTHAAHALMLGAILATMALGIRALARRDAPIPALAYAGAVIMAVAAATIAAHVGLHGFVNALEPRRYLLPAQDFVWVFFAAWSARLGVARA